MSLTPVGDYLRKRYPPQESTHWVGQGDDPGCCGGAHPACLYPAAWREAMRSLAADFDAEAMHEVQHHAVSAAFRRAAEMARSKAEESPS